jgi:hypothetical protein
LSNPGHNGARSRRKFIDKIARAANPKVDTDEITARPGWWWIFFMPGKVILWIDYMFPNSITNVFGSARRRNVPLMQVAYSLGFYALLFIVLLLLLGR